MSKLIKKFENFLVSRDLNNKKNTNEREFEVGDSVNTSYGEGTITYIDNLDKVAKVKIDNSPHTDFYLKDLTLIKKFENFGTELNGKAEKTEHAVDSNDEEGKEMTLDQFKKCHNYILSGEWDERTDEKDFDSRQKELEKYKNLSDSEKNKYLTDLEVSDATSMTKESKQDDEVPGLFYSLKKMVNDLRITKLTAEKLTEVESLVKKLKDNL